MLEKLREALDTDAPEYLQCSGKEFALGIIAFIALVLTLFTVVGVLS